MRLAPGQRGTRAGRNTNAAFKAAFLLAGR